MLESVSDALRFLGFEGSYTVNQADIRKAYRSRSKVLHPDSASGSEESFKKLDLAYKTVKDLENGTTYDLSGVTIRVSNTDDIFSFSYKGQVFNL